MHEDEAVRMYQDLMKGVWDIDMMRRRRIIRDDEPEDPTSGNSIPVVAVPPKPAGGVRTAITRSSIDSSRDGVREVTLTFDLPYDSDEYTAVLDMMIGRDITVEADGEALTIGPRKDVFTKGLGGYVRDEGRRLAKDVIREELELGLGKKGGTHSMPVSRVRGYGFRRDIPFTVWTYEDGVILSCDEEALVSTGRDVPDALDHLSEVLDCAWEDAVMCDPGTLPPEKRRFRRWLIHNIHKVMERCGYAPWRADGWLWDIHDDIVLRHWIRQDERRRRPRNPLRNPLPLEIGDNICIRLGHRFAPDNRVIVQWGLVHEQRVLPNPRGSP